MPQILDAEVQSLIELFQLGGSHEQTERDPLALMSRTIASLSQTANSTEAKMQNEIEILESRETPSILWG